MRRSFFKLQFWDGSLCFERASGSQSDVVHGSGDNYGSGSHGQYYAFRDVQLHGKSDGGIGHSCSFGGPDTDALYAGYSGTLDAGKSHGPDWRETGFE